MFGKKRKQEQAAEKATAKKSVDSKSPGTELANSSAEDAAAQVAAKEAKSAPQDRAENGPYDASETPQMRPYVDLGSIKVVPREGLGLRLDVDQSTNRVMAVSLDFDGSVLQLQAFAAPKSKGLWHSVREQLQQGLRAQNATVKEQQGEFGPELLVAAQQGENGQAQTVRFVGVDGPRWMLRGVIVGPAAVDPQKAAAIATIFRDTVVVRGENPMPPSELLPLKVPAAVGKPEGDTAETAIES